MSNTLSRQNVLSQKLFGIYFGGYSEDISGDFVPSFKEHSELCDEKDGTKSPEIGLNRPEIEMEKLRPNSS